MRRLTTNVKACNLKLGDIIYVVSLSESATIVSHKVTGIVQNRDNNNPNIYFDYQDGSKWFYEWSYWLTFSEAKAKKMQKYIIKHWEYYNARRARDKAFYEANKKRIEDGEFDHLINLPVMIRTEKRNGTWIKSYIYRVYATYKPGVFSFLAGNNHWLLSKEGQNWYYWSREKELLAQRDKINAELKKERKKKKEEPGRCVK